VLPLTVAQLESLVSAWVDLTPQARPRGAAAGATAEARPEVAALLEAALEYDGARMHSLLQARGSRSGRCAR